MKMGSFWLGGLLQFRNPSRSIRSVLGRTKGGETEAKTLPYLTAPRHQYVEIPNRSRYKKPLS